MDGDYVMMLGKEGGHLVLLDLRSSMCNEYRLVDRRGVSTDAVRRK
jgi:hypothetical protein